MRLKHLALPAALAAATLALATFASPAFADNPAATIYPAPDEVTFSSSTTGSVTIDYLCGADVQPALLSADLTNTYLGAEGSMTATAGGSAAAICDGTRQSATVALELTAGEGIYSGALTLHATLGPAELTQTVTLIRSGVVVPTPDPTPTEPPAPALATVSLTTNASPESVIKGKKITIKGTIRKDGKKFKAKTRLEFAPDSDGGYAKVRSVKSSKSGKLSTKVKASSSGSFRYVYAGSATAEAATSSGDHIVVTPKPKPAPKPKAYANCDALTEVYPHGVGKAGAQDKTSSDPVTDFTRDDKTYAKNTKSDRDKDGIACERH